MKNRSDSPAPDGCQRRLVVLGTGPVEAFGDFVDCGTERIKGLFGDRSQTFDRTHLRGGVPVAEILQLRRDALKCGGNLASSLVVNFSQFFYCYG